MTLKIEKNDSGIVIHLGDKFDFSGVDEFKSAYENNTSDKYTIDFRETNYMDSSGLGMLLNMKRSTENAPIDLINCKSQIKKILVVSRFDEQFQIS